MSHSVLRTTLLATLVGVVGFLVAPARSRPPSPEPSAPPILPIPTARCDDVRLERHAPRGLCQELAAAPRLSPSHPHALAALAVWSRVAEPVEALTERVTGLVLLGPEARRRDGRPLPPAPWICPGTPPVVYVPFPLLEQIYEPADGAVALGEDLLGFALAHELGHRVNDLTLDGCPAAFAGGRDAAAPGVDPERLADFRGAFFAAVAGVDARSLARDGVVARFLASELAVRPSDVAARTAILIDALGWFDAFEELYQAGLALALAGERGAAVRFLDRLAEQLAARGIPLPEVTLVHALALLSEAAPAAPWLDALDALPSPAEPLACRVVHPSHGAFAEITSEARVRGGDPARRAAARRAIERARRLVDRAADLGAAPLAIATARACGALLAGQGDLAVALAEAARRHAPRVAGGVRDALEANAALARFVAHLGASPVPIGDDAERAAWLARLATVRPRLLAHAALDRFVAALVGQPATPPSAGAPRCSRAPSPPLAPLPPLGPLAAPPGSCPAGWERFASPAEHDAGPRDLVLCRKRDLTLVRASLPPLVDPPLPALDTGVVLMGAPPPHLRQLDAWVCGCERLAPRGVSELGEDALLATCPRLGVNLGLVLADARGRVRRVAILQ